MRNKKPEPTFVVRLVAAGLVPESVPLRLVNDALTAVQDIASGRDPLEEDRVPTEKSIGLLDIKRGSAVYSCVARVPEEAVSNLSKVGPLLHAVERNSDSDALVSMFRPIQKLSEVAKKLGCRLEVGLAKKKEPFFAIDSDDYDVLSSRLLLTGDTTIVGTIERAGGATEMRCLLRLPNRRKLLYCDVDNKELVRRLGQHLYEEIAADGTATWIHRSWYIYHFTIRDFSIRRLKNPLETIQGLRDAGLDAWDTVDDPEKLVRGFRS